MPSIQNYQLPGLSVGGYLQPKLVHRFTLMFQFKPEVAAAAGTSDYLSLQVNNASRPNLAFDKADVHRYNSSIKVLGRYKWEGNLNFSYDDDIGGLASGLIQAQLNMQQQVIGATGGSSQFPNTAGANGYKFLTILTQWDGQNQVPIEQWQYEGCFILNCNWGKNDYTQGGSVIKPEVVLSFDNAVQILNGNTADNTGISGFSPCVLVV